MNEYKEYAPVLLRIALALLFIPQGINKLMGIEGTTAFLTQLGFPVPILFVWVLLLSEILFGLAVLFGWKVKYTALPLIVIMAIALLLVTIPSGNLVNIFFHVLAIAALVSLVLTGAGKLAISKN